MRTTPQGIRLIKHYEQCKLKPYICPAGVPTIGWGNTFYDSGRKVTMKDAAITQQQADQLFEFVLAMFERDVTSLLKAEVTSFQFDALVSFAYNVGTDIDQDNIPEGLGDSTLLRLVNANPFSEQIPKEFLKWNKSKGEVMDGLTKRRKIEAHLYSTGDLLIH